MRDTGHRIAAGRRWFAGLGVALATALAAGLAAPDAAQAAPVSYVGKSGIAEVTVARGKSRVLELPERYTDLMIADPKVADVLPLNTHSIYIVGKGAGSTALNVYGPGRRLIAAVNVVVAGDLDGFKSRLHQLLPDEKNVTVSAANGSMVLSGTVSSPAALRQVMTLAETYSPKKVVNMMTVEGTQEVMLTVRFVEMQRSTAKDLRLNASGVGHLAPTTVCSATNCSTQNVPLFAFNTGDDLVSNGTTASDSFANIAGLLRAGSGDVSLLFDALETKGVVKTLAEPTLVAQSGETASFLAGGEFPIPVAQAGSGAGGIPTLTVAFKQFGVALSFTPTLLKDGLINLVVNPEVSAIDPANSISSGGVVIPGLRVRRAHTTVELRDGESFTIAGMMSEDYSNNIRQLPWIGDLPILGALFRSTSYQRGETELVIVVTPHLAVPQRKVAAAPGDHFIPPSDFELFLLGSQAGAAANLRPEDRALMSVDPSKGGVEGPHGHVLY
jgi:pilus assembly protein CpaC